MTTPDYSPLTNPEVVKALEAARTNRIRVRLHFGNTETGEDWMDTHDVAGYIGHSTGTVKTPIIVANLRSMGGPAISTECVIRIRPTAGGGEDLYRHPRYHLPGSAESRRAAMGDKTFLRHFPPPHRSVIDDALDLLAELRKEPT